MMVRRLMLAGLFLFVVGLATSTFSPSDAMAAGRGQPTDWNRFYYYPYVYYPQNFQRPQGSYDNLYYRYPENMRIPVYNQAWHNFYPSERPYHKGNHFKLDVF